MFYVVCKNIIHHTMESEKTVFIEKNNFIHLCDTGDMYILSYDDVRDGTYNVMRTLYELMDITLDTDVVPRKISWENANRLIQTLTKNRIISVNKSKEEIYDDIACLLHSYEIEKQYNNTNDKIVKKAVFADSIEPYNTKHYCSVNLLEHDTINNFMKVTDDIENTTEDKENEQPLTQHDIDKETYFSIKKSDINALEFAILYHSLYQISLFVSLKDTAFSQSQLEFELKYNLIEFKLLYIATAPNHIIYNMVKELFHKKYESNSDIVKNKIDSLDVWFNPSQNKEKMSEKEIIMDYFKNTFIFSDSINERMKASELYEYIINNIQMSPEGKNIIDNNLLRRRLQGYLMEAGLQKKRFSDGYYYYGIKFTKILNTANVQGCQNIE